MMKPVAEATVLQARCSSGSKVHGRHLAVSSKGVCRGLQFLQFFLVVLLTCLMEQYLTQAHPNEFPFCKVPTKEKIHCFFLFFNDSDSGCLVLNQALGEFCNGENKTHLNNWATHYQYNGCLSSCTYRYRKFWKALNKAGVGGMRWGGGDLGSCADRSLIQIFILRCE